MEVERAEEVAERGRRLRQEMRRKAEDSDGLSFHVVVAVDPREPKEHVRQHRVPGRRRMVVELLLAVDEPLAVGGRVEEAAVFRVAEQLHGQQRQPARFLEPAELARRDVQLVQTVGHVCVVLEHARVLGLTRTPRPEETTFGGGERPQDELCERPRRIEQIWTVEPTACFRECGKSESVPRGDRLVVAQWLRPPPALSEQAGARVGVDLASEDETTVLERV